MMKTIREKEIDQSIDILEDVISDQFMYEFHEKSKHFNRLSRQDIDYITEQLSARIWRIIDNAEREWDIADESETD